jgi:tRNA A-37 threonylcarbamoyl transferase component Bud32
VHPSANWLKEFGLVSAEAFLSIQGEIVSGHPDRHVMRVRIGQRTAYLKREHSIRLRDRFRHWYEGFGWVSKSAREAKVLQQLEAANLPAPRVLAFGEDRQGRGFLLVEDVASGIDLRRFLASTSDREERNTLATRLGQALAELHDAGFHHPDLYAKHFLINESTYTPVVLDWQRARQKTPGTRERIRALASLDATLADHLASTRDRLRLLWAYRRVLRQSDSTCSFAFLARKIANESKALRCRGSIREQRQVPLSANSQRLVWLDGEALCVIPELVEDFQKPILRQMTEDSSSDGQWLIFADGRCGKLEAHRYHLSMSRWWARLRGRAWRSPELRHQRLLFHLERHHITAPRVLVFGQRAQFGSPANAFLIAQPVPDSVPLFQWYDSAERPQQLHLLRDLGAFLARLYEARCFFDSGEAIVVSEAQSSNILAIADTTRLAFVRRLSELQKLRHLAKLWREFRLRCRRSEGLRILLGYCNQSRITPEVKTLARSILREAR